MKKQRKHYTSKEKAAILKRLWVDKEPIWKMWAELGLQPESFDRLQREFFENLAISRGGRKSWYAMEVKSFELEEHPDQLGRNKLIEVTEKLWPELWHGLRAWINQGATEPLRDWAARQGRGIKDDWFVEVLDNTARFWRSDPQSDAAQLKPGSRWSRVPPATIGPMFVIPRFSRPYPDFMETPAGFKKRMRAQFNYELDLYTESRRKSHAFNTNPKYETHLKWTCLALKGLSAIEIASSPSDSNKEYRDLEQAVSRAIKLTASRIGLVLSLRS